MGYKKNVHFMYATCISHIFFIHFSHTFFSLRVYGFIHFEAVYKASRPLVDDKWPEIVLGHRRGLFKCIKCDVWRRQVRSGKCQAGFFQESSPFLFFTVLGHTRSKEFTGMLRLHGSTNKLQVLAQWHVDYLGDISQLIRTAVFEFPGWSGFPDRRLASEWDNELSFHFMKHQLYGSL